MIFMASGGIKIELGTLRKAGKWMGLLLNRRYMHKWAHRCEGNQPASACNLVQMKPDQKKRRQDRLNAEKGIQMHQANTTSAQTIKKKMPKKSEPDQGHWTRKKGKSKSKSASDKIKSKGKADS